MEQIGILLDIMRKAVRFCLPRCECFRKPGELEVSVQSYFDVNQD